MSTKPRENPRVRRLRVDYESLLEVKGRSDILDFEIIDQRPGVPPEKYILEYRCRGIARLDSAGNPEFGDLHRVAVYLHPQYPNRAPGLKWMTDIWHPNIDHINGSVCIDAVWWAAGRSLEHLVIMMWEMLTYRNFHDDDSKPPFPLDKEAAKWCKEYKKSHPGCFPVDQRQLLRPQRIRMKLGVPGVEKKSRIRIKA